MTEYGIGNPPPLCALCGCRRIWHFRVLSGAGSRRSAVEIAVPCSGLGDTCHCPAYQPAAALRIESWELLAPPSPILPSEGEPTLPHNLPHPD